MSGTTRKINFNARVANQAKIPVYIKEVQVVFSDDVKNLFHSGDVKLPVGKWFKPDENTEVAGEWLFDSTDIVENNVMDVSNYVSFKVKFI